MTRLLFAAALAGQADIRRQRHVARDFFPYDVKRVVGEPHVLPAASNLVNAAHRIEPDGAGLARGANLLVILEDAKSARLRTRYEGNRT